MKTPNPSPIFKLSVRFLVICFTLLIAIFTIAFLVNKPSTNKNLNLKVIAYQNPPTKKIKKPIPLVASKDSAEIVEKINVVVERVTNPEVFSRLRDSSNNKLNQFLNDDPADVIQWEVKGIERIKPTVPTDVYDETDDPEEIPIIEFEPTPEIDDETLNLAKSQINKAFENWKKVASWGIETTEAPTEAGDSTTSVESQNNENEDSNEWTTLDFPFSLAEEVTQTQLIDMVEMITNKLKELIPTPEKAREAKGTFSTWVNGLLIGMTKNNKEKVKRAMAEILRDLNPNHNQGIKNQFENNQITLSNSPKTLFDLFKSYFF